MRWVLAVLLLVLAGCSGGGSPKSDGPSCPPSDQRILELVTQANSGVLPEGARVSKRECVGDYVVVGLDSTEGAAQALLRRNDDDFEALLVGGDLCEAPVVKEAPAEVRDRLAC